MYRIQTSERQTPSAHNEENMGMKRNNHHASDIRMACIEGGSKARAWRLVADLTLEPVLDGTVWLYDMGARIAGENRVIGSRFRERREVAGRWGHKVTYSLKEALKDADFVVISTLPGAFEEMRSDIHLPGWLGIYQSVGGMAGPGGMVRVLRTLSTYEEIALAIREFYPFAWVIGYTNLISLCVVGLYRIFPKIRAFGCRHGVFGTQEMLTAIISQELGAGSTNRRDIHINILGVNHFTRFDAASYEDVDLFLVYKKRIGTHFGEGYDDPDRSWKESTSDCRHRVKSDLPNHYGLIAAAGDRHLTEFTPGNTYLSDPEAARSWKFGLTTVGFRISQMEEHLARRERLIQGGEQMEIVSSGEERI